MRLPMPNIISKTNPFSSVDNSSFSMQTWSKESKSVIKYQIEFDGKTNLIVLHNFNSTYVSWFHVYYVAHHHSLIVQIVHICVHFIQNFDKEYEKSCARCINSELNDAYQKSRFQVCKLKQWCRLIPYGFKQWEATFLTL